MARCRFYSHIQKSIIRNTEDQGLIELGADSKCVMTKVSFGINAWSFCLRSPVVAGSGIHPFRACPLTGSSLMDVFQREELYDGLVGGDVLQC